MEENILEKEKITKLIIKFAVPCVISMVVAALYNIVDQIFIGWSEAGSFGNAATNIVYPFTVFVLGFGLLIGDGAAANFSLFLGSKNNKKANQSIGNGLVMLIVLSIIITILGLTLRPIILKIFGANPNEEVCYQYAVDYYTVICLGIPFYMIGQGLNGTIRADGSPKYAMACTTAGAIFNIIFDPLFIFVFGLGVKGAAIATILGQILTFILSVIYLFKSKSFKINSESVHLDLKLMGLIISIGMASLIVQLSIVAVSAVNNNLFGKYGYTTTASTGIAYGYETPLAVVGIVMKVFGIVVSIAIGIGLGGQPIIGYNMGAKNFKRVKECVKTLSIMATLVGAFFLIFFELTPNLIIKIFGNNNTPEYLEYACKTIRIFLCGIALTCFIKVSSIILQSMGNSVKSTIVALMRDVIIFIPTTIIIAEATHNIESMLWAAVISDVITSIVAFILVRMELKNKEKLCGKENEII